MTSIHQLDVAPLFRYLTDTNRLPPSTYLGTAQFGTETFHTDGKSVTFDAKGLGLMMIQAPTSPLTEESGIPEMRPRWHWALVYAAVGLIFLL